MPSFAGRPARVAPRAGGCERDVRPRTGQLGWFRVGSGAAIRGLAASPDPLAVIVQSAAGDQTAFVPPRNLERLTREYGPTTWDVYEQLDRTLEPRGPDAL